MSEAPLGQFLEESIKANAANSDIFNYQIWDKLPPQMLRFPHQLLTEGDEALLRRGDKRQLKHFLGERVNSALAVAIDRPIPTKTSASPSLKSAADFVVGLVVQTLRDELISGVTRPRTLAREQIDLAQTYYSQILLVLDESEPSAQDLGLAQLKWWATMQTISPIDAHYWDFGYVCLKYSHQVKSLFLGSDVATRKPLRRYGSSSKFNQRLVAQLLFDDCETDHGYGKRRILALGTSQDVNWNSDAVCQVISTLKERCEKYRMDKPIDLLSRLYRGSEK